MPYRNDPHHIRSQVAAAAFTVQFGSDTTKLKKWQDLCWTCGVTPIPISITKCKKALRSIHVNLYDLVEARDMDEVVPEEFIFASLRELRNYSRQEKKIFRKSEAKEDTLLGFMLRRIFS